MNYQLLPLLAVPRPSLLRVRGDEQQPPGDARQLLGEGGAGQRVAFCACADELAVPVGRLRRPRVPQSAGAGRPRQRVAHGGQEGLRRAALPLEGE